MRKESSFEKHYVSIMIILLWLAIFSISFHLNVANDTINKNFAVLQLSHNQTIDWIQANSEVKYYTDDFICNLIGEDVPIYSIRVTHGKLHEDIAYNLTIDWIKANGGYTECKPMIIGKPVHFLIGTNISTEQFFGGND